MPKIGIVIPTIRDSSYIENNMLFLKDNLENTTIYIIEDKEEISINPKQSVNIYCRKDIYGLNFIPFKSDAIRNFGFLKSYEDNNDITITFDDDCIVSSKVISNHIMNLSNNIHDLSYKNIMYNTLDDFSDKSIGSKHKPRGYPYKIRTTNEVSVGVSHGLWYEHPDFDACRQMLNPDFRIKKQDIFTNIIPKQQMYTMCGMNLSFLTKLTPIMYFIKPDDKYGIDRFADIWCGFISKKILDHINLSVVNGNPAIIHSKASNPYKNLIKESAGLFLNEEIFEHLVLLKLPDTDNIYDLYNFILDDLNTIDHEAIIDIINKCKSWLNYIRNI